MNYAHLFSLPEYNGPWAGQYTSERIIAANAASLNRICANMGCGDASVARYDGFTNRALGHLCQPTTLAIDISAAIATYQLLY
jgi:hypothetical protein